MSTDYDYTSSDNSGNTGTAELQAHLNDRAFRYALINAEQVVVGNLARQQRLEDITAARRRYRQFTQATAQPTPPDICKAPTRSVHELRPQQPPLHRHQARGAR